MNSAEILKLRLQNTGLSDSRFKSASEVVAHLGAVQSQDYAAAKWGLGLRIRNSTDQQIEEAFNRGAILRTHVLRPTWHFVMPEDIRWMLQATAPRVKRTLATYDKKLGLDEALFLKTNKTIVKALEKTPNLTRAELKDVLQRTGIGTNVQRLAHIVVRAELEGLICSGPRRGKQITYALLEQRVLPAKQLKREEALARLALTYFTSHGPAQLKDFAWWSGLTAADAKNALQAIQPELIQMTVDGKNYWSSGKSSASSGKSAFLLSIFDEYTIAYKDRSDLSKARDVERMVRMGSALTSVIILDNQVAGAWKKITLKNVVQIQLQLFRKFTKSELELVKAQVSRYGKYIETPAVLI